MSTDFDWIGDDAIVVREQDAIAVYEDNGDVVIRRRGSWSEQEDAIIVVARDRVRVLAEALLHRVGLLIDKNAANAAFAEFERRNPPSKDRTAAERARRYRERHASRRDDRDGTVTSDGVANDDSLKHLEAAE